MKEKKWKEEREMKQTWDDINSNSAVELDSFVLAN